MSGNGKGAIAAGHELTAEAGAKMLRLGGNAVDAGLAALAMSCVCEPVLASPGGGGFAMVRNGATGETKLIDFFPQTPLQKRTDQAAGYDSILANFGTATQEFHIGPATVATPGFMAGVEVLRDTAATMPLTDLFAPAIAAAESGFRLTAYQHYLSTVVAPILTANEASRKVFAPGGALPQAGAHVCNPGLAEAFRVLSGGDWSSSCVADKILESQEQAGHISQPDLEAYRVERRKPVTLTLGGTRIFLNPLPAASGTIIRYALSHLDDCQPVSFARALAAADQARLAARGELRQVLDRPVRQKGTTHISVVDGQGNACAITVSNGTGSGQMVGGYGFSLNNILGEGDVNPHGSTDWPTDTRLASMMCPTLLETSDGRLVALGSGGSNRIRSAIFQTVARLALTGAGLAPVIGAPRLHVEDGHLDVEDLLDEQELSDLIGAFSDHRLWPEPNMFFGGVHAVSIDGAGAFDAVGDSRREGAAIIVR